MLVFMPALIKILILFTAILWIATLIILPFSTLTPPKTFPRGANITLDIFQFIFSFISFIIGSFILAIEAILSCIIYFVDALAGNTISTPNFLPSLLLIGAMVIIISVGPISGLLSILAFTLQLTGHKEKTMIKQAETMS